MKYSVIAPVYNSGDWLEELVTRIVHTLDQLAKHQYEIILVNDCSPDDNSWAAIKKLAKQYPSVRGVNLLYNVGQFKALMCGMELARGEQVITIDDDLQHPPEEIAVLVRAMEANPDMLCIFGKYEHKQHSWLRNLGSRVYQAVNTRVYGKPVGVVTSSFRLMQKSLVNSLVSSRTHKPQISPMIVSLTKKVMSVDVKHARRLHGFSGYTITKLTGTTLESIINASTAPLRYFSLLGIFAAISSFSLGLYVLLRWLSGGVSVAGFTSQILLITFFGGMTLAGIGLLGEYLSRIIYELTGPERYKIKQTTDE